MDLKASVDDEAFYALDKEFDDVLRKLQGDSTLEKFRSEFEKLFHALKKSHDGEKRLMGKCRELNAELLANAAKVQALAAGGDDDDTAVVALQKEVDQAWRMVDAARENEATLRDTIEQLRQEISSMTALVEQGSGVAASHGEDITELLQQKKDLSSERDKLLGQITTLRTEVADITGRQQAAEAARVQADQEVVQLKEQIASRRADAERETRKRDALEREILAYKSELEQRGRDIDARQADLAARHADMERLEQQLHERRVEVDELHAEAEALQARIGRLTRDVEDGVLQNRNAGEDNHRLKQDLKSVSDELGSAQTETTNLQRMVEVLNKKLRQSEDKRIEAESKHTSLKGEMSSLQRELDSAKKQTEADRAAVEDLTRTRDMLQRKILQAGKDNSAAEALVKLHENAKSQLQQEIAALKEETAKQMKHIVMLEKERDRSLADASHMQQQCVGALEEVKLAENQLFDYKKKLADAESRLHQQKSLYETVRSERNLHSKNLIEAQGEIADMKRKLKIMNHQIDQLKDEISAKEAALAREHTVHDEIEQHKARLKSEVDRLRQAALKQQQELQTAENEHTKLRRMLSEAEAQNTQAVQKFESVVAERDLLSSQLVRRNEDLAALYEKLRVHESTLSKGETQYQSRVDDIRTLRKDLKGLQREKTNLSKSVSESDSLRQDVFRTQRELVRERLRCRALEDELETPMNVHRWRRIEGSDPAAFEMVQKIQTLQRRLVQKTEEVAEKELLIQEREKQYVELKELLSRQPGPEMAEQIALYQETLKDKNRQMRAMASELNMFETQVAEYKFEMERLAHELQDIKKKYFDIKRSTAKSQTTVLPPVRLPQQARFVGGGFNVSLASPSKELSTTT